MSIPFSNKINRSNIFNISSTFIWIYIWWSRFSCCLSRLTSNKRFSFVFYFLFQLFCFFVSIDFQTGEWIVNPETGKRERLCTYKVGVAAVFGATTICSNEKQVNLKCFSCFLWLFMFNFRLLIVNHQNLIT